MFSKKGISLLFILMTSGMYLPHAQAACAFDNGAKTGNVTFVLPPLSGSLNPSESTAQILSSVTMNSAALASSMSLASSTAIWKDCTGDLVWTPLRPAIAGISPENTGYITTGINNLYLYLYAGNQTTGSFGPFNTPTNTGAAWSRSLPTINGTMPSWSDMGNVTLVLYKTGPISQGGVIPAGTLASLALSDGLQVMNMSMGAVTVNVQACSITTPSVNVNMPVTLKDTFTGIGSVSQETKFTIGLQCDSGVMPTLSFRGPTTNVNSEIFDLTDKDSSAATGVGIQLRYSGATIKQDDPVALGTMVGGPVTFPFSAQYIQTSGSVTAGKANSTITFTLAYK